MNTSGLKLMVLAFLFWVVSTAFYNLHYYGVVFWQEGMVYHSDYLTLFAIAGILWVTGFVFSIIELKVVINEKGVKLEP